jgi:hypothetical protein
MPIQPGRFYKRIRLAVPVKLLYPGEAEPSEDAVTENVSPLGVRVLVKTPKQPDTVMLVKSPAPKFRASVRVVYCEPLPSGEFGVGLQLHGPSLNWTSSTMETAV